MICIIIIPTELLFNVSIEIQTFLPSLVCSCDIVPCEATDGTC